MLGVALPFGLATPTFIIEPIFFRYRLRDCEILIISKNFLTTPRKSLRILPKIVDNFEISREDVQSRK